MEDLAPGIQGDQIAGCGVDEAELAMIELAKLHGPRWGDQTLVKPDLISASDEERAVNTKALYDMLAAGFLARYDDRLTADEKDIVRQVGESMLAFGLNYQGESTLIHIDYRLDNMMFGGPYPLAVVDWQSLAFGCALNDASYFIGTSVHEDIRADVEESLVRRYHEELTRYSVDLTWEDCWHYYRHHAPAGLIMAVIASMIVGETDRGNDMFMAMAKRSARMSTELDAISAINNQ
jgi:aminoglycoside phosphotransferase (APT) family kinase protein